MPYDGDGTYHALPNRSLARMRLDAHEQMGDARGRLMSERQETREERERAEIERWTKAGCSGRQLDDINRALDLRARLEQIEDTADRLEFLRTLTAHELGGLISWNSCLPDRDVFDVAIVATSRLEFPEVWRATDEIDTDLVHVKAKSPAER